MTSLPLLQIFTFLAAHINGGTTAQSSPPARLSLSNTQVIVPETLPIGAQLTNFQACLHGVRSTDNLRFVILNGDPTSHFSTAKLNGTCWTLVLRNELEADQPGGQSFTLTVQLSDSRRQIAPIYGTVDIIVEDINENAPHFTAETPSSLTVGEGTAVGARLMKMTTVDKDSGLGAIAHITLQNSFDDTFNVTRVSCSRGECTFEVHLRKALNFDVTPVYNLVFVAEDGAQRLKKINRAMHSVVINVEDQLNNPPRFVGSAGVQQVREDAKVGSRVLQLKAVDGDQQAHIQRQIKYSIVDTDDMASSYFGVDASTGWLFVKTALDRDSAEISTSNGVMTLTVRATEISPNGETESATRTITINVVDVDDSLPRCEFESYDGSIAENAVGHTPVTLTNRQHIRVSDADDGMANAKFTVSLRGVGSEMFTITPGDVLKSANLVVSVATDAQIDYEATKEFQLTVVLSPTSSSSPSPSACNITIAVRDVNDNPPLLQYLEYNVDVWENRPIGTHVAHVIAIDNDGDEFGRLEFTLTGKAAADFRIDAEGNVTTAKVLDREAVDIYDLAVNVVDNGGKGNRASAAIRIVVLDENDNAPLFSEPVYTAYIGEHARYFSRMADGLFVHAVDSDERGSLNSNVTYSIDESHGTVNFTIDEATGEVRPKPNGIDRDVMTSDYYNVTLIARDNGSPHVQQSLATLIVIVNDTNDNAPIFAEQHYRANAWENATAGSRIVLVSAVDGDVYEYNKRVSYSIPAGSQMFDVDAASGWVTLKSGVEFDGSSNEYSFTVLAVDHGQPQRSAEARVTVNVVDVNDETPVFPESVVRISIAESTPAYTMIANVTAVDGDVNSLLMYTKVEVKDVIAADGRKIDARTKNYTSLFAVQAKTGDVYLTESIDREEVKQLSVVIAVTDINGQSDKPQVANVTLIVTIVDINDNAPVFSLHHYLAEISEGSRPGTPIMRVEASDIDSSSQPLRFVLDDSAYGLIDIDAQSGDISVASPIDREQIEWINTTVFVYDAERRANANSANISIRVLDENDNRPQFTPSSQYMSDVSEDALIGTKVIDIRATDLDSGNNAVIQYELLTAGDNVSIPFTIDATNGEIRVSGALDRETMERYTLTVRATDNPSASIADQHESTAILSLRVVDVNDNRPSFIASTPTKLILRENDEPGDVLILTADDVDEGANADVTYSILVNRQADSDISEYFEIDAKSGALRLVTALTNRFGLYKLTVEARDGGDPALSARTTIEVQILDYNDNRPIIETPKPGQAFFVFENHHYNISPIVTVFADDADDGDNAHVVYAIVPDAHFYINTTTGDVWPRTMLDREEVAVHELTVQACDLGVPPQCTSVDFVINVRDVNDNCPKFVRDVDYVMVLRQRENMPAPSLVGQFIAAIDDDGEEVQTICYRVIGDAPFSVAKHGRTNQLMNSAPLDREQLDEYNVLVVAEECERNDSTEMDRTVPLCRRFDATLNFAYDAADKRQLMVKVEVSDENDNDPRFTQRLFRGAAVRGDGSIGARVARVQSFDLDVVDSLTYAIVGDVDAHLDEGSVDYTRAPFTINSTTGDISTNIAFAPHWQGFFRFDVVVRDAGGNTDSAEVVVNLLSVRQQVQLVFDAPTNWVWERSADIIRMLEVATGVNATIDDVQTSQHRSSKFDSTASVIVHFVDQFDNVIEVDEPLQQLDVPDSDAKMDAKTILIDDYHLRYAGQTVLKDFTEFAGFAITTYIAIGGVLLSLVLILTVLASVWCTQNKRYQRKLKAATTFAFGATDMHVPSFDLPGTNLHASANPLWSAAGDVPPFEPYYDHRSMKSRSPTTDESSDMAQALSEAVASGRSVHQFAIPPPPPPVIGASIVNGHLTGRMSNARSIGTPTHQFVNAASRFNRSYTGNGAPSNAMHVHEHGLRRAYVDGSMSPPPAPTRQLGQKRNAAPSPPRSVRSLAQKLESTEL